MIPSPRHVARILSRVHVRVIVIVFGFWLAQLCAWVGMMAYVEFFPNHLRNSILYTIQISHWALVITCGTAATATWGVITTRTHSRTEEIAREHAETLGAIRDLAELILDEQRRSEHQ